MNRFMAFSALLAAGATIATPALANDRYATPPPVVMSPNLTAPWVMQLQNRNGQVRSVPAGTRQVIVRRERQPLQRIVQPQQVQQRFERPAVTAAPVQQKPAAQDGLDPMYLPQVVNYSGNHKPGTLVISTKDRFLYLVMEGGQARRYGVGVGKQGFTWRGTEKITRKQEWPSWRPPATMIAREKKKGRDLPTFMPGGPDNPLGSRALYLGSTLYRIHGTNAPWSIGQAVSSGCIRMRNEDVADLYERVPVGATVVVL
ncbi:MAG: L,D-transpeptidase [Ahrensia sp.]